MIGLSVVNRLSNSRAVDPCGCSDAGYSLKRSTTLTNRSFSSAGPRAESPRPPAPPSSPRRRSRPRRVVRDPLHFSEVARQQPIGAIFDPPRHIRVGGAAARRVVAERPADAAAPAVVADGLRDRQDVRLVERAAERRAPVAARAETDPLRAVRRVGRPRRVLHPQAIQIDEKVGRRGLAGERMDGHHVIVSHPSVARPVSAARARIAAGRSICRHRTRASTTVPAASPSPAAASCRESARAGARWC
jgi:hypothetical protein